MNHTQYKNRQLHVERLAIADIAKQVGTPFYCYSQSSIEQAYQNYQNNLQEIEHLICYAIKANSHQAIIQTLAKQGAGADVVSEGELRRALKAGIPADKIVYSGVAKTAKEIQFALEQSIYQFNVESENELEVINQIATEMQTTAPIAFRINPDVDANTHAKISTGKSENKFGIPIKQALSIYKKASKMAGIKVQGVDVHIGSQLTDLTPFRLTFERIKQLVKELAAENIRIEVIDLGGGLGVNYEHKHEIEHEISDYCAIVNEVFADCQCKILLEPGRSLVAASGTLVSKVVYKKQGAQRVFLIIDAAMNDLLRPSMYDAYHEILSVEEKQQTETYDIVGPVCETGDTFARNRQMTALNEGELLAITNSGAYGAVMASTYNTRLLVPEVLVKNNRFAIIKTRESYSDLIDRDQLAEWQ